jgi:hypothetical protein
MSGDNPLESRGYMSKKPASKSDRSDVSWQDRLHTIAFSYSEEGEIAAWYATQDRTPFMCFEELVDSGWSVKVTPPGSGDDYWVSVTGKHTGSEYDGQTYTVRYPGLNEAMLLAYYVITVWGAEDRLPLGGKKKPGGFLKNYT